MISPSDIKAGAQFVVTVASDGVDSDGWVEILGEGGTKHYVRQKAIAMVSSPSPTTAIDAQIVKAADALIEKRRAAGRPTDGSLNALAWAYIEEGNLTRAVDRRRATLKPLDAGEELLDVIYRNPVTQEVAEAAARVRKERGE